jgi:hypothetical protein
VDPVKMSLDVDRPRALIELTTIKYTVPGISPVNVADTRVLEEGSVVTSFNV